ncbi:MAG TPA: NAD(P)H-hydrate epimerase, partial [Chitinispirillaceae bacterium]|nr:NAD(P)H-hydrate epimerase [Chitinispirillaceae bacterium]
MIPVLTVAQMREIDEKAICGNLTIGYSYMLRAGLGLYNAAIEMISVNHCGSEIAIICGKGNNGGDGYVAGRMLLDAGHKVMCYSLCDTDELRGEARIAFDEYIARKGNFLILSDIADLSALLGCALIIDAMLGTGLRGDPRGICAQAIEAVNSSGVKVLSVDTPSGLNNDTGIPGIPCVKATVTVTMGFPKIGLYFYPGRLYTGKLIIHDLGYPDEIVAQKKGSIYLPSLYSIRKNFPQRHPGGSKFDHGLALLVCGAKGYTGAPTMVAEAALRTGCGMTHLAAPESTIPVLSIKNTETVLHSLSETENGTISFSAFEQIRNLAKDKDALCIGPGLTYDDQTCKLVREVIRCLKMPTVLDADGINSFKGVSEELKKHCGELIITPHRGEWQRLFGELPPEPLEVISKLKSVANQYHLTILLKGSTSIVAN